MSNVHELVIIGSGPGGMLAFRAADLGLNVTLIEKDANLEAYQQRLYTFKSISSYC